MAEFRALRSGFERMLHLRARTFAPITPSAAKPLQNLLTSQIEYVITQIAHYLTGKYVYYCSNRAKRWHRQNDDSDGFSSSGGGGRSSRRLARSRPSDQRGQLERPTRGRQPGVAPHPDRPLAPSAGSG